VSGNALYAAERARQLTGTGDPQTAGEPGDHRAYVAAQARPCECGTWHSGLLHVITEAGSGDRGRCSVFTTAGRCRCGGYKPASNPVAKQEPPD
jgi:hypothetical protein